MPKSIFYIPNGPKNLQPLFLPQFLDIEEYYVEVLDSTGAVIATTGMNQVVGNNDDFLRIHFLNSLGAIDSISFILSDIQQDPKSDLVQSPIKYPLVKSVHSLSRFNIRSTDIITLVNVDFHEEDMDFVSELISSPLVWMQWDGTEGQSDDYIPVVINDAKVQKRKLDERFTYEITITVSLSHERFTIRN